jgi:hypothetical protein
MESYVNNEPKEPFIDGPKIGKPGVEYCWTFTSTDPDGDDIFYFVDWGDGTKNYWLGPLSSPIEIYHEYEENKVYVISAKVMDIFGDESDWSELVLTIPRTRASSYLWLEWLLECFPILVRLLELFK